MANQLIVFCETLNKWIAPRYEPYRFLHGGPRKVGDEDEIIVEEKSGSFRRVRVMLCKATNGYLWLVDIDNG